jgi:uncharacterized membrane protein YGL010W
MDRHRGPLNFALHMIGIPVSVVGMLLLPLSVPTLSWRLLLLALGCFAGGYVLQFLGHWVEGSDPGEVIALKRRLGRPYVEYEPRRRLPMAAGDA